MATRMSVKSYYKDKKVLITGGTGFVGQFVVEKLLRSTDVGTIYLLMRPKPGEGDVQDRFDRYFELKMFNLLEGEFKYPTDKVIPIAGDILKPRLGLRPVDEEELRREVQIVIHLAASVKYNNSLQVAFVYNVLGTEMIADLADRMTQLESFVHVSTVYSFCNQPEINERLYPMTCDPMHTIGLFKSALDSPQRVQLFAGLQATLLADQWPNTYVYSKALAEHLIADRVRTGRLPAVIVRPSIITPSAMDPVIGMSESRHGPMGAAALALCGIARTGWIDRSKIPDMVSVDLCAGTIIAIPWEVAEYRDEPQPPTDGLTNTEKEKEKESVTDCLTPDVRVYNVTTGDWFPISWYEFALMGYKLALKYPSMWTIRPIAVPRAELPRWRIRLTQICSELLFAHLADVILRLTGHKRFLVATTKRLHKGLDLVDYFLRREWKFETTNFIRLLDRLESAADGRPRTPFMPNYRMSFDMEHALEEATLGFRRHILNDPDETIPRARRQYRIVVAVWTALQGLLVGGLLLALGVCLTKWMAVE